MFNNTQYYQWFILLWLGLSAGVAQAVTDCNQVMEIRVSERQSLLELYNNTNGAKLAGMKLIPLCSWFRITCENGYVGTIDLSGDGSQKTLIPNVLYV